MFFVDIVRRHSHPHNWVLNTPFFFAWLANKAFEHYWRRHQPEVVRVKLSDDYMLLFWEQEIVSDTAGPKFYMRMRNAPWLEQAHVFTGFENRCNLSAETAGRKWTSALIVRVYHKKRAVSLSGATDARSHTETIADAKILEVDTWGPYLGSMSEDVRLSLSDPHTPVCTCAGGSAIGYCIDAIQLHKLQKGDIAPLVVCYTTRDAGLFNWVVKWLDVLAHNGFNAHIVSSSRKQG